MGLASELCQIVGDELFFTWHTFLEVGKTQDLTSKIWQTLEYALRSFSSSPHQTLSCIRIFSSGGARIKV
jgi:hypothetical protein